ncbi:hypothetical protein C8R43DRAFT_1016194 [Mycena crocata]|nr:hypothetical protein C8R43DRAFT_1016194 [Mycena crocata]
MSTDTDELNPCLPVELEREIFELTAETHLPGIPGLLLVARRVKFWTLIIWRKGMYSYAFDKSGHPVITPERVLQLLNGRPASFFRDHVRNLVCANTAVLESETILTRCSGAENIFFLSDVRPALLPLLTAMAPRRLYMTVSPLFHLSGVEFAHALFSRVTHLFLDHANLTVDHQTVAASLVALQGLTHLTLAQHASRAMLNDVLTRCACLAVLVVIVFKEKHVNEELSAYFAHDHRFVQLVVRDFLADWMEGTLGRKDYWSRAEAIIHQRQTSSAGESTKINNQRTLLMVSSLRLVWSSQSLRIAVPRQKHAVESGACS